MARGLWPVEIPCSVFRLLNGRGRFQTFPYVPAFARQRQQNIDFSSGMGPGSRPACPASSGESVNSGMWPVVVARNVCYLAVGADPCVRPWVRGTWFVVCGDGDTTSAARNLRQTKLPPLRGGPEWGFWASHDPDVGCRYPPYPPPTTYPPPTAHYAPRTTYCHFPEGSSEQRGWEIITRPTKTKEPDFRPALCYQKRIRRRRGLPLADGPR